MKTSNIFFTLIFCISLPVCAMYPATVMKSSSLPQRVAFSQKRFSANNHPLHSKIKQEHECLIKIRKECERLKTEIPAAYAARERCADWHLSKRPVCKDDGYCSKEDICECDKRIHENMKAIERLLALERLTKMNPVVFTHESEVQQ